MAKIRVRVDTNPNPKTACFKKKIDPTSAPTPALLFTDTLLTKAYLDDLNSSSEIEAEKQTDKTRTLYPGQVVMQPRPQGAFPWLWKWAAPLPKPGKSALGTRLVAMKPKRVTFAYFVIQ